MSPKRADANQPEIVAALRKAGATVQHLHEVGQGTPDILCGFRGKNYLMELKTERGELNARENLWHVGWRGQVNVVRSAEQALALIGVLDA